MKNHPADNLELPSSAHPAFLKSVKGRSLVSGEARLIHSSSSTDLLLECDGVPMAYGNPSSCIGLSDGKKLAWFDIGHCSVRAENSQIVAEFEAGPIKVQRRYWPCKGGFGFRVSVTAGASGQLFFFPAMMLYAGQGSFGSTKQQALFCGLEHLEGDEPSSSEKDIVGPESMRRLPLSTRVTLPLMAVNGMDRFAALAWKRSPQVSAFFDSPDRTFDSEGHAMGLLLPGSNGDERNENDLVAYRGLRLSKRRSIVVDGWLLTGKGSTAVDAIKAYLAVAPKPKPLKPVPMQEYAKLAARGWLDSGINENGFYRHAYWSGIDWFKPTPSPDAAYYMKWLEPFVGAELAARLSEGAKLALRRVEPTQVGIPTLSHLPTFGITMVMGSVRETVAHSEAAAKEALSRIRPDGTQKYVPAHTDFGKTHFADHASGLTGQSLLKALECAMFVGDPELLGQAIEALRRARVYRGTVPRGAQTWEIALHTPDIMASAHLCKAYSLAYQATGDASFLEDAEYWAATGLPFVYLDNPTGGKVGRFATIAVYGATNWEAPNWMGLPVQWCGATYADALYALSRHSKNRLWKTVADGIFDSGVAQTFNDERTDLAGLLPDSFVLSAQTGNAVAINPGTLQALAPQRYGLIPFYSWLEGISAPGRLSLVSKDVNRLSVKVEPAFQGAFWVVIGGPQGVASLRADGKKVDLEVVARHAVAARLKGPCLLLVEYRSLSEGAAK